MNSPYIYEVLNSSNSETAIIILPDIFMLTDYAKNTANTLSKLLNQPTFVLNYFYDKSGGVDYFKQDQGATPSAYMTSDIGMKFNDFFNGCVNEIITTHPAIKNIIVVGFCFGGRLAYLTGLNKIVSKIVSFYGAGANDSSFCNGQSVVQLLSAARSHDSNLKVLAFYGTEDNSITPNDRELTNKSLAGSGINYLAKEYNAGHAYFQEGRASFDKLAAENSMSDLRDFIK